MKYLNIALNWIVFVLLLGWLGSCGYSAFSDHKGYENLGIFCFVAFILVGMMSSSDSDSEN